MAGLDSGPKQGTHLEATARQVATDLGNTAELANELGISYPSSFSLGRAGDYQATGDPHVGPKTG
jgi:hypothetical protein